jgi:hypothetical protein
MAPLLSPIPPWRFRAAAAGLAAPAAAGAGAGRAADHTVAIAGGAEVISGSWIPEFRR